MEQSPSAKRLSYGLFVVLLLSGVTFFFGLGRLALVGPDEPRYAEVAREMLVTGDYITPRLCGCLWFEKPALLYWMAAGSYRLFGVGEYAARFPSALAAFLSAMFIFFAVRRAVSLRLAFFAALVLTTSAIFIGYARAVTTDMALAAAMSVALVSAYLYTIESGRAKRVYWILCWAATGLAALAKGLVGVFLIVVIVAVYFAMLRQIKLVRWQELIVGAVIFLAVAAVWYLPVTIEHGRAFIDEFIINHHFKRYLTNKYRHPQPVYFYPFVALAGIAPWTFFLIPAIARARLLKPRSEPRDSLLLLAWIWVFVPLIFFSFSESKLPGYILPIFPALAIIAGAEIEQLLNREQTRLAKAAVWMTAFALVVIGVGFLIYLKREAMIAGNWQMILSWLPLVAAALSVAALALRRCGAFIASASLFVASAIFASVLVALPRLSDDLSLKSFSLEAAAALTPQERIAFYLKKEYAPVFYAQGRVVCDVGGGDVLNALAPDEFLPALAKYPSLIIITTPRWQGDLLADTRFDVEIIETRDDATALRLRLKRASANAE